MDVAPETDRGHELGREVPARAWGHDLTTDDTPLEAYAFGAGALPLVGTAETVAEGLRDLYEAGIDGVLFCFHDFLTDTRRVGTEIVPLLEEIGIAREPALEALARTPAA